MRVCRPGLLLIAALPACWALSGAAVLPAGEPVSVLMTAATDEAGARVTLTFSRRVDYRLEESRGRLRLRLAEEVSESSLVDRDFDGDVLKRVRFDATSRGTEVVFHLGRAFATFSSAELDDPFRVMIRFEREDGARWPPGVPGRPPVDAPAIEETPPAGDAAAPEEGGPGALEMTPPDSAVPREKRVAIDPGHGGDEEGAVSRSGLKEKDLVLDIARRLGARLGDAGYAVTLTRDGDEAVGLTERTARANHAGAGLFISIHANSSMRSGAHGAETYFLAYGASADEQAMSVARQENLAGIGLRGPAGDDSGEIRAVLWDMAQAEFISASSRLAAMIQSEMNGLGDAEDRGVRQAPFRVLVGAAMPAVLVEVGFLTNGEEEGRLATPDYRDRIAQALATAVQAFSQEREEGAPASGGRAPR